MFGQSNQQQSNNGLFNNFGQNSQNSAVPANNMFAQMAQNQAQQTQPQASNNIFANQAQQQQQQTSGVFGGFGQPAQNQQSGGIFGQTAQSQPSGGLLGQSTSGGLFGQSTQNQTSTGLFGQTAQNQSSGGLFGQPTQNQTSTNLFGQTAQNQPSGGLFGQSTQNQTSAGLFGQTTKNQQQPNISLFGQSQLLQLPQLGKSGIWQPNSSISPREKSIPEQMAAVFEKWNTSSPNCAFKYYFYNKVDDNMAPYYRPGPNEDPKAWEEALSNKPDKGYIPVLCVGFAQMGERIKLQQRNLASFNARLHEINNSLTRMMQDHETRTSIKAMDARRKHMVLKQRCIALATKVQVLRNRGYTLGGDEEDLKIKLLTLEKNVNDPALGARGEEIWARMLAVQDRAQLLQSEIGKSAHEAPDVLGEELTRRAKKILEDYHTQLGHLSNELDSIKKDYEAWLQNQGQSIPKDRDGPPNSDHAGSSSHFI
ncbi:hypothetical protein K3495_g3662 [Podosphaera aphanis]|nr:hypothetical protein K3495_g3662 [Podosphaera aphanis]